MVFCKWLIQLKTGRLAVRMDRTYQPVCGPVSIGLEMRGDRMGYLPT